MNSGEWSDDEKTQAVRILRHVFQTKIDKNCTGIVMVGLSSLLQHVRIFLQLINFFTKISLPERKFRKFL